MANDPEPIGDITERLRGTRPGEGERSSVARKDQLGLDEQVIEDADVEAALDERQKRRNSLDAVRKVYDEAHEKAIAEIAKLELPEGGAARVGPYRITRQSVPARSVSFESKATTRIRIALADEG